MGSQPVKSTLSWPLGQLLALGYCTVGVPVLMWKRKPNNPFPLKLLWSLCFIKAIQTLPMTGPVTIVASSAKSNTDSFNCKMDSHQV